MLLQRIFILDTKCKGYHRNQKRLLKVPEKEFIPECQRRVTRGAKQSKPSTIVIEDPYYTMYPFLLASSKMALTRKFLH